MAICTRSRALPCGLAACLALIASAAADAVTVIDDFVQVGGSFMPPQTTIGTNWALDTGLSSVLDGRRLCTVAAYEIDNLGLDSIVPSIDTGPSDLSYLESSGAKGAVAVRYGVNAHDLSVDFSGDLGILITFDAFESGESAVPVVVNLVDNGVSALQTLWLTSSGPQTLYFEFANFSNIESIDLDSLNLIAFQVNGDRGTHVTVDQIASFVPAPGALTLLGLAGLIAGRRRRR